MLGPRPPELEFRVLCLEGSVISCQIMELQSPIVLCPNEVLIFSIATFFGIEIEMVQIFAQRII